MALSPLDCDLPPTVPSLDALLSYLDDVWRDNTYYRELRQELPYLKRQPSDYLKSHIWFTTQPIEESERRPQLTEVFDWMRWDRILFATDYPHWDFDDPVHALPSRMTDVQRRQVFLENARTVFGSP